MEAVEYGSRGLGRASHGRTWGVQAIAIGVCAPHFLVFARDSNPNERCPRRT